MSLLEDVFLQDEANEAQELERVIEGDEYDERPRSVASNSDENSAKEDEAEEEKRRVDPAGDKPKRIVKNPRFLLNPARLTGPRGIQVLPEHFKDFKFKGKGNEKEDLDLVLKKLEHWAYRLYPKFGFEDCLKKIETLGKKKPVMVHLHKIRSDQFQSEEIVDQKDSSDDENNGPPVEEDEFDKLLQQQIDLARATPAPDSVRKPEAAPPRHVIMSPFAMPKATSSPSISEEQRERMLRNRKLAEERRLARLKQNTSNEKPEVENVRLNTLQERISNANNNSDSSDEDSCVTMINQSTTVQINATSNREGDIDKNSDQNHVTDDDIAENRDKSKELTFDNDVELSETYTEQQKFSSPVTKQQPNETLPEVQQSSTYTKQQSETFSEQQTETYTEKQHLSQTDMEQQHLRTHTEPQENMEVCTEDLNEQNGDLLNADCTDKRNDTDSTVAQNTETHNSPNVTNHIVVLGKMEENCFDVKKLEQAIVSEDNIEERGGKIHNVSTEKEENSADTPKSHETKIVQDKVASEIDKVVEEDLMDVDFDDDF